MLRKNPLSCCTRDGHLKVDQAWGAKDAFVFVTMEVDELERRMPPLLLLLGTGL